MAPKRWTFILYSFKLCVVSPLGHHRKRRKSTFVCDTFTWWNMAWMSAITCHKVTCYCLNLVKTPNNVLARFMPCCNCEFNDTPLKTALQSNTTLMVFFLGWYTPWCGMYYTLPLSRSNWSCGTASAYPLLITSARKAMTLLETPGSNWTSFSSSLNVVLQGIYY